jgi:hypothetical protein
MTAFDEFVKNRHSRAGGNPDSAKLLKRLDSRFHGNDGKGYFKTLYGTIAFGDCPLEIVPFPVS